MSKRIAGILIFTIVLLCAVLPNAMAASWSGTYKNNLVLNNGDTVSNSIYLSGGTQTNPLTVTVKGTVNMDYGIIIQSGSYVRITGGGRLLRNNTSSNIIEINSGAHLTLDDITVDGNNKGCYRVAINTYGELVINEKTIICNNKKSDTQGSAIYAGNGADITMNGGEIKNNNAVSYGTIYLYNGSSFELNGGTVSNNTLTSTSSSYGGGAFYVRQAILTMNGGTISGNKTSSAPGAGIYCSSYGTVHLNGGVISGNRCGGDGKGNGVYFSCKEGNSAALYIGGNIITDAGDDIYLDSSASIKKYPYITSALKYPLTLTVNSYSESRIIAQGTSSYTLTESDMAKITLKVGNTTYYSKLESNKNQLIMTNTNPGYTQNYYISYDANNGSGTTVDNTAYSAGTQATIKANSFTRSGYTFTGWNTKADGSGTRYTPGQSITMDKDLLLYAQWSINACTIRFVNYDGTVLQSSPVAYGTMPSYTGSTPTKAATAEYSYTFAGWDKDIVSVTGEATYTAQYTKTANVYTITFANTGNTRIDAITQAYGTAITAPANPTKEGYTFAGWDASIPTTMPAENLTITAKWTVNQYTITFNTDGGSAVTPITADYGTAITAPADPKKVGYTFAGWDASIPTTMPAENLTITAKWTVNRYTITFENEDGSVLQTSDWDYGATPSYEGTPTKAADAQYTYTFTGWSPEIASVTGDKTYTATYSSTVNKYKITFKNEDGTVMQSSDWDYGATPEYTEETPTKIADAQYTYAFAGWSPEIAKVTGEATYTATYSNHLNTYTVTWVDDEGNELEKDEYVLYGTTPSYDGTTPTKAATAQYTYTFAGWSPAIATVQGDVTYTAVFDSTVNKYLITFKNEDGTELQSGMMAYGDMPSYTGEAPTKKATAQYTYVFKDWTPEVESVTGEATYTAAFGNTINTYAIKFVANGGDGTMNPIMREWGETFKLPVCEFTAPKDYAFKCWLVKGDFDVVKLEAQELGLIAHAIAEDTEQMLDPGMEIIVRGPITLEAQWQEMPQTGDHSTLGLWIRLMGMACAALFVLKKRVHN